jgi:hypothetical protein
MRDGFDQCISRLGDVKNYIFIIQISNTTNVTATETV